MCKRHRYCAVVCQTFYNQTTHYVIANARFSCTDIRDTDVYLGYTDKSIFR